MTGDVANDTGTSRPRRGVSDRWLACVVFLVLGAIYVATLLPGLGGTEDTPKFQYVGAALGTPHDPGYPLYMIACWVFSKLPVGTLAYRINLLSACWGALAGAFVYLAQRRLAVPRALAGCVALGLGLGRAFWAHSTFAEAYTQVSALTAAAFLALLVWDEDGRERWLYAAVAAVCLAFGTHLIIVGMVPAFAWFVLTRYRWRIPLRVLAVIALIVGLGLAQYGYVWWRTAAGSPYLESSARSLRELVDVLRARQFETRTFHEPALLAARTRVPEIARIAWTECGTIGGVAALVGLAALWRRRRLAVLLGGAVVPTVLLLASLGDVATDGILLPALMPCWILAGAGFGWLWSRARPLDLHPVARRTALAAVVVLAAAVPTVQAWRNAAVNDRHDDTFYTDYFAALVDRAPDRSAFAPDDYIAEHMLRYQAYVSGRDDVVILKAARSGNVSELLTKGSRVFAFEDGLNALRGRVHYTPVTLRGATLEDRLRRLPPGTMVLVAGWASAWPGLSALGQPRHRVRGGRAAALLVVGQGAVLETEAGFEGVFSVRRGDRLGTAGSVAPMSIRVDLRGRRTTVQVDDRTIARNADGLVVVEIGFEVLDAYGLPAADGFRVPLDMRRLPLYEVLDIAPANGCTDLGERRWSVLSAKEAWTRLDAWADTDSDEARRLSWLMYLASDAPARARISNPWHTGERELTTREFVLPRDGDALRARLEADGVPDPDPLLAAPFVARLELTLGRAEPRSAFTIDVGSVPRHAVVRAPAGAGPAARAAACAVLDTPLAPDPNSLQADLDMREDWHFGAGWQPPQKEPVGVSREATGTAAYLSIPIQRPADVRLVLDARTEDASRDVHLIVNGHRASALRVSPWWSELAWTVPAAWWRPGGNSIILTSDPGDGIHAEGAVPAIRLRGVTLAWEPVKP
jgi:hypothetical protein